VVRVRIDRSNEADGPDGADQAATPCHPPDGDRDVDTGMATGRAVGSEYPEDKYEQGVRADVDRVQGEGFELVELRNSWENEEYKGINSRWRLAENSQLFEVQFHTRASFEGKQQTHGAYERLRTLPEDDVGVFALRAYQREVTAKISVPPGAVEIPNYP
jgi:hypothetical protein